MIISLLPFEDDDRAHGNGLVLHLGLYVKGGIHGFYKHTKHFPNVCRVLNQLLLAVCPGHCWSAITIGANNRTLPHRDKWNHEGDSLLLGVSHQVDGGLWVESAGGSHYDECQEQLLAGVLMDTISTGVLFNGRSCWHATQSWTGGNRVVIVAYVPGHAERVKDAHLAFCRLCAEQSSCIPLAGRPSECRAVKQRLPHCFAVTVPPFRRLHFRLGVLLRPPCRPLAMEAADALTTPEVPLLCTACLHSVPLPL